MGQCLQPELDAAMDQITAEVLRAGLRVVIAVDVLAQLTQISVPILYMQARAIAWHRKRPPISCSRTDSTSRECSWPARTS